jgi:peptidoglycan glycosyltransferase
VIDLKLLTKRALGLLVLALLVIAGLLLFTVRYALDASSWAMHPTDKHLYTNGILKTAGKIYDRNGEILLQTVDGVPQYNDNKTVRRALMPVIGDSFGNIATSLQVAYSDRLSGWDPVNGAYRFNDNLSSFSSDIILTLDSDLCATAYNAMNGRKGTVGVYNYKTGEILCMVSLPTFDPENRPDVEADPERYEGVYINRLLSGVYTPGSVFKLVTAAAAIDNLSNIGSKVFHCEGKQIIDGAEVTDLRAHGDVDFRQALAESCNIAFAEISLDLGGDTLQEYAEKAGFNSSLKVNGIRTAQGRVAVKDAQGGDLAWAGIGQYNDLANPLNFMAYVGAIANDGVRVTPKFIDDRGIKPILFGGTKEKRILSQETAARLGEMMRYDVTEVYGENRYKGLELCAKSGTAEVGEDKEPHSWFVGYLDREDCPLAFVVVVENGGAGSKAAGSVAAKVLKEAVTKMTVEE